MESCRSFKTNCQQKITLDPALLDFGSISYIYTLDNN